MQSNAGKSRANKAIVILVLTALASSLAAFLTLSVGNNFALEQLEPWVCPPGSSLIVESGAFSEQFHGEGTLVGTTCCDDDNKECENVDGPSFLYLFLAFIVPVGLLMVLFAYLGGLLHRRFGYQPILWGVVVIAVLCIVAIVVWM